MSENNNKEQQLTKKERGEQKRIEREKNQEKRTRIRKVKKVLPWLVFVAVIVLGIYWVSVSVEKSNVARPGDAVSIMGADHIGDGDPHEPYNSNPPTSGPHAGPAPWGFSEDEIPDENALHNLEHGGIWISYKNLDDDSIAVLGEIARRNRTSVVVSPREANDVNIAVASWGRLMKLDAVDEERINEFIQMNKNKSPERLAI